MFYDYDGNTWLRINDEGSEVVIGLTSLLSGVAGKLASIKPKNPGTQVSKGSSLATLESNRMIGPLLSPLTGVITATNSVVVSNPRVANESPYDQGWIVALKPVHLELEQGGLLTLEKASPLLKRRIVEFHVRCFKVFPDLEMVEVGVECGAVLAKLTETIKTMPIGTVIHVVSDDPTSYVEMVAWSERMGQELIEWRQESDLYHFIIRKKRRVESCSEQ